MLGLNKCRKMIDIRLHLLYPILCLLAVYTFFSLVENVYTFDNAPRGQNTESAGKYSIPGCGCVRPWKNLDVESKGIESPTSSPSSSSSTCSDYSTQRGTNQTVFSYSYYHPKLKYGKNDMNYRKYLHHVSDRAEEIKTNFPGSILRLYHNVSREDKLGTNILCQLFCRYDHVDLCDVTNLPGIGNLHEMQPIGRLWRFAVMGDPTVHIFNVRDTDSAVLPREKAAVQEWLSSPKTFHIMRDYPFHVSVILAGLWGSKNYVVRSKLLQFRDHIFSRPPMYRKSFDQDLLKTLLWPFVKNDMLQHNSYLCQKEEYHESVPFPTRREDNLYVGWGFYKTNERDLIRRSLCPEVCRPKEHKDWIQC